MVTFFSNALPEAIKRVGLGDRADLQTFSSEPDSESNSGGDDLTQVQAVKPLVKEAFKLCNQGDYRGAIEKFDQVISWQQNATNISAKSQAKSLLYRAQTLMQMRAYEAALKDFRQAIQLDPHSAKAWHGQGVAKAELRLYPSAVDSFARAIACEPFNDKVWYNQGQALLKLEQPEKALESFDRAIELDDSRYHVWYSRALAQAALEQIQLAVESLEQAIALKKSCHYAWNYRGTLLNRLFQHQTAIESFWQSLRYRVPNANAWYGLASTYALLNNPDATAIHLRQAIELNPIIYSLMARNDINFDRVRSHPKVSKLLCD
ncbi:MAG: tetratricopeptide repeat protein [Phormidesmis sp.]